MTKDEVMNDVQDRSLDLMFREPFYGHVLAGVNKKISDKEQNQSTQIQSLGMTTIVMSIDADKWLQMSKPQREKRLKKELMHYIFMHPWEEQPSNRGLFYTSCDISANKYAEDSTSMNFNNFNDLIAKYYITSGNGRKAFETDGWTEIYRSLILLKADVDAKLTIEEKTKFAAMAMLGQFWNGSQLIESIFYLPQTGKGDMNLSSVSQMVAGMKGQPGGASDEDIQKAIEGMLDGEDDPWKSVSEGTSDLGIKEIIKNAFKDAKMRGDVPGEMGGYVDALLAPAKIDWKHEVKKFTSTAGNVVAKTTMSKRSKRFGTFPATKITRTQRIAIIADSSGSVSDEEFVAFFSELRGLLQANVQIIFIQADAGVDQVDIYNKRLPEQMRINRQGYGGTAFGPALKFVRTQGRGHAKFKPIGRVDGTIYMTDGYAPAPKHNDYPMGKMMWITTQKSVNTMKSEGFEGHIVLLDLDK